MAVLNHEDLLGAPKFWVDSGRDWGHLFVWLFLLYADGNFYCFVTLETYFETGDDIAVDYKRNLFSAAFVLM